MARDWTLENFLKELGTRIGAAAVVVGVFAGLGSLARTGFLGLSHLLGDPVAFVATAFLLVGLASAGWIAVHRYRA